MQSHQICHPLRQLNLLCSGSLSAEFIDGSHIERQSVEGVITVDQSCQNRRGLFGDELLAMDFRQGWR